MQGANPCRWNIPVEVKYFKVHEVINVNTQKALDVAMEGVLEGSFLHIHINNW